MKLNEFEQFQEMQREVYGERVIDWPAVRNTEANLVAMHEGFEVAR